MKRLWLVCLTAALLLDPLPARALEADVARSADYLFRAAMEQDQTLGGQVALMGDGKLIHTFCFGLAGTRPKRPVTDRTLFRVASVTKMVSALGIMALCEDGKLDLDQDIGVYLGFPVRNPAFPEDKITLRQLMSHTSGILHNGDYARKDTKERMTLRQMLWDGPNVQKNFSRKHRPGEAYAYSNFGAGILGSVMESVTGQTVEAFMRERIFAPLGVTAVYHPASLPDPALCATAYRVDTQGRLWDPSVTAQKPPDPQADPLQHYDVTVGSLLISATDLCRLTSVLCLGGSVAGVTLLQKETVALMCQSQTGLPGVTGETPYGLCVRVREELVKNRTIWGHQGTLYDIVCEAFFDPAQGSVVVMLTNATLGEAAKNGDYLLASRVLTRGFAVLDRP